MGERLSSIPPSIRRGARKDVLRLPLTIQVGGGGLGSLKRAPQQRETWVNEEQDWGKVVDEQTFRKPARKKPTTRTGLSEIKERIGWEAEVMERYNAQGDLGIFLQFNGINLAQAFFMRGKRYYGPDTTLFYSPAIYDKGKFCYCFLPAMIFLKLKLFRGERMSIPFSKKKSIFLRWPKPMILGV